MMHFSAAVSPKTPSSKYEKGLAAEAAAKCLLEKKNYRIVRHRYRTAEGEIDLIAERGDHLAFVEVKCRKTHAEAAYALQPRQQARIANAASLFLAGHSEYSNFSASFDVMLVTPREGCTHLENAFLA